MEIFELLFGLPELCGCFLQMMAAGVDVSTGVAGYRLHQKKKLRKQALANDEPAPKSGPIWPFLLLVFFAVLLTAWSVWAILRDR